MNINLELYKTFYTVAKLGNITKAANKMNISQPGISKSIKSLEDQLNCKLFTRSKNGVNLTQEGKQLYEDIRIAIDLIDNAQDKLLDMKNLKYGVINIGISKTLAESYLLPYLEKFHNLYPDIKIDIHTDSSQQLINKVKLGLVDFIIVNTPFNIPNDMKSIPLLKVNDCFIANEKYNYLKEKNLSLKDLNNYPLILPAEGSSIRYNLDKYCNQLGIELVPNMEIASHSLVLAFTKIGFGIGFATEEFVKDDLINNKIFKIELKEKISNRYISITYPNDSSLNAASKKFINMLKEDNNIN